MLQTRLEKLGAQDYLIKVNYVTGEIVLELEENKLTDKIVSDVYTAGTLKMVDSEGNNCFPNSSAFTFIVDVTFRFS